MRRRPVGNGPPRDSSAACRLPALRPLQLLAASPRHAGLRTTAALRRPHSLPHGRLPAVVTATGKTEETANPTNGAHYQAQDGFRHGLPSPMNLDIRTGGHGLLVLRVSAPFPGPGWRDGSWHLGEHAGSPSSAGCSWQGLRGMPGEGGHQGAGAPRGRLTQEVAIAPNDGRLRGVFGWDMVVLLPGFSVSFRNPVLRDPGQCVGTFLRADFRVFLRVRGCSGVPAGVTPL